MTPAVEAVGLAKSYGSTVALDGLDLVVGQGTVQGVLGPNGAGKTTLIRILATLTRPTGGTARVCGHDVVSEADRVRRLIGLTGQYAAVDLELTARENLCLLGELVGLRRAAARGRAAELLDQAGLAGDGDRVVRGFSGGMRRRLDLAVSLVARPSVLFLDEPSTGLDPDARASLWEAVRALRAAGTAIVLTSQYLEEIDALADRVCVVDHGRVVAEGATTTLKERVGERRLRITPPDGSDVVHLARAIAAAGVTGGQVEGRAVVVAVDGAGGASRVLAAVDAAGIGVAEVSLALPSLDEVFFALTGPGVSR